MTWTAILHGGAEFSDTDGAPDDVPRHPRVVAIAQAGTSDAWRPVLVNGDWYVWRDDLGCWTEHSDAGLMLELVDHAATVGAVRAGKYVNHAEFERLWARAREIAGIG